MDNDLNFETYLFISEKKFIIYVNSETNDQLYKKELIHNQDSSKLNLDKLDHFLNENIFKIEKILNGFVKKIIMIVDTKDFFSVDISIKKNNYGNILSLKTLNYLLYDLKDYCKKSTHGSKIIHMIIQNYLINGKTHNFFPENIKCSSFSLDVKFICLPNNLIKNIEMILKKYQISLKQSVNANYISKFLNNDDKNVFLMSKKLIEGYNRNEVLLVDKINKKQGFFEKFFNFFS
mgnify:CR=1 FL=1